MIPFQTLKNLIDTTQKLCSSACLCKPIQNIPLLLNKLVRLNKAVLQKKLVNASIIDYGHLINSAGEILDYDKVTKKFDIPPNNSSFTESLKFCAAIPSCLARKKTKIPNNLTTIQP